MDVAAHNNRAPNSEICHRCTLHALKADLAADLVVGADAVVVGEIGTGEKHSAALGSLQTAHNGMAANLQTNKQA